MWIALTFEYTDAKGIVRGGYLRDSLLSNITYKFSSKFANSKPRLRIFYAPMLLRTLELHKGSGEHRSRNVSKPSKESSKPHRFIKSAASNHHPYCCSRALRIIIPSLSLLSITRSGTSIHANDVVASTIELLHNIQWGLMGDAQRYQQRRSP